MGCLFVMLMCRDDLEEVVNCREGLHILDLSLPPKAPGKGICQA